MFCNLQTKNLLHALIIEYVPVLSNSNFMPMLQHVSNAYFTQTTVVTLHKSNNICILQVYLASKYSCQGALLEWFMPML